MSVQDGEGGGPTRPRWSGRVRRHNGRTVRVCESARPRACETGGARGHRCARQREAKLRGSDGTSMREREVTGVEGSESTKTRVCTAVACEMAKGKAVDVCDGTRARRDSAGVRRYVRVRWW